MKNHVIAVLAVLGVASASFPRQAQAKELKDGLFAIRSEILANLLAKELCSCLFVTGAYQRYGKKAGLERCFSHASLPLSEDLIKKLVDFDIGDDHSVKIDSTFLSEIAAVKFDFPAAIAIYHKDTPQYGCSLVFGN